MTVSDIRNKFKDLDTAMKGLFVKASGLGLSGIGEQIRSLWAKYFGKPLSKASSESLSKHFSMLYGKKGSATKGGAMLEGAPIGAEMRPGLPQVMTYGTFPTEVGADAEALKQMDVYYNSGISRSCGTEDTTAVVGSGIGSNLVPATRGGNRRRTQRSKTKGGNFLTAMNSRLYVSTNPSNPLMRGSEMWSGVASRPHDSSDPSDHAWTMQSGHNMVPPTPAEGDASAPATAAAYQPALEA